MKKQYLKKLGYGFSALVLGLSAVNFFPATSAFAIGDEEPSVGSSTCALNVTTPTSTELEYTIGDEPLVFEGTFTGDDVIVQVDGTPADQDSIEIGDGDFTAEIEFTTAGEHTVKALALCADDEVAAQEFTVSVSSNLPRILPIMNIEQISKVANVGETVTVEAPAGVTFTVHDITNNGGWYAVASVDDAEDVEEDEEDDVVGPDVFKIEETSAGKYAMTAMRAGNFVGQGHTFIMKDGVPVHQLVNLDFLAVGAADSSATTITDIINGYAQAGQTAENAWFEYEKVATDPNATEEEKAAALEKYTQIEEAAYDGIELKEVNAFGEDSMAIWEAAYSGKTLSTKVQTASIEEADLEEDVKNALLEKLDVTFASNVKYYDVDVNVYADGEKIGTLKELTNDETVVISGFSGPAAGFKRVFQVVRYHTYVSGFDETTGEPIEEVEVTVIDDVEFNAATGEISFASDKFSTYAVAYKDVLAASVNTGEFTSEGASASASVSVSVIAAIAAIALFGAVKFVKAKRN